MRSLFIPAIITSLAAAYWTTLPLAITMDVTLCLLLGRLAFRGKTEHMPRIIGTRPDPNDTKGLVLDIVFPFALAIFHVIAAWVVGVPIDTSDPTSTSYAVAICVATWGWLGFWAVCPSPGNAGQMLISKALRKRRYSSTQAFVGALCVGTVSLIIFALIAAALDEWTLAVLFSLTTLFNLGFIMWPQLRQTLPSLDFDTAAVDGDTIVFGREDDDTTCKVDTRPYGSPDEALKALGWEGPVIRFNPGPGGPFRQ